MKKKDQLHIDTARASTDAAVQRTTESFADFIAVVAEVHPVVNPRFAVHLDPNQTLRLGIN